MDAFAADVRRTISRWQMIAAGERLLVAVSGGADSTALLAVLHELELPLVAAHLNHGWRGAESDRDEEAVRRLARRLGVPVIVDRWPAGIAVQPATGGLEQRAREVRYAFLRRAAAEHGCTRIATGHTRDDQAETVLLRLLRGSGLAGLAGILPVREDGVIRPLLEIERGDVLAYLERRALAHVEDSSNRDLRFDRNRVRLLLLPELRAREPHVVSRLAALAATALSASNREDAFNATLLAELVDDRERLDLRALQTLSAAAGASAVRAWLRRVRGDLRQLGRAHLAAVTSCDRSGARVELPGGGVVANEHGLLHFIPRLPPAPAGARTPCQLSPGATIETAERWQLVASSIEETCGREIDLPLDLWKAVLDADRVGGPISVRTWRHGDRIQPLGMKGSRKLSDVFVDAKVPRWQRPSLPIVEAGGAILWIPGVIRSATAIAGSSTARVLRLHARPPAAAV